MPANIHAFSPAAAAAAITAALAACVACARRLCALANVVLAGTLILCAPGTLYGQDAVSTPIFVLHSYSQEYPWTKRQHEAFLQTLGTKLPGGIDANVEHLDTKRVAYTDAYAAIFADYLRKKYAGFAPRLIYVTDDAALLFAQAHLTRIFPDAPVFFSGVNDFEIKQRIDPARVTGIFEKKSIAPNLELMRRLSPDTRDILVLGDGSSTFQAIHRDIEAELAKQGDIRAHIVSRNRIDALVEELRTRNERFVFLTTLGEMTNAAGRLLTLPETMAAIVSAGEFSIISMEDAYLYPGILGGYVTSGNRQGAAAAGLAARFLSGTALAAISPVESSTNEYIFDGTELEKRGLVLPQELVGRASIVNPVQTLFQRNVALIERSAYAISLLFLISLGSALFILLRKNRQLSLASDELAAQAARLRENEDKLRGLFELSPLGITLNHWDGRLLDCNSAFQRICGYSLDELKRLDYSALTPEAYHAEERRQLEPLERAGFYGPYEKAYRHKNGELVPVRINGMLLTSVDGEKYVWSFIENMAEQKAAEAAHATLEAQLRESQKIEAIGTLAGGIAHDFNNIIAVILGNAALLRQDLEANPKAIESLTEIRKAGQRARDLVQQILSFSHRQPVKRRAISIAPVLDDSIRMLRAMLPARIALNLQFADRLPHILADATQIQQIVVNIATNSMQAMEGRPGNIDVRVDTVVLDARMAAEHPELNELYRRHPGQTLRLTITDDGPGMNAAVRSRIFEPFFTTKPPGKGTGLGLSVVHGIVKTHEGAILIQSTPGAGTTFSLYLPVVEASDRSVRDSVPPLADVAGQGQRILFLDDDESLVFLVTRLLGRNGYRVDGYSNQDEALAAVRGDPAAFDLLVTDYNMPGLSGLEIAREVRRIRADLPVAVVSGFIDETLQAQAADAGVSKVIFKANDVETFCAAVRDLTQAGSAKRRAS